MAVAHQGQAWSGACQNLVQPGPALPQVDKQADSRAMQCQDSGFGRKGLESRHCVNTLYMLNIAMMGV